MFKCISIDIHAHNEYIKLLGGLSYANRKKMNYVYLTRASKINRGGNFIWGEGLRTIEKCQNG